jgi:hypothetical protein
MGLFQLQKKPIDEYFLEKRCDYTGRRPFKMKAIKWTLGVLACAFICVVLYCGSSDDPNKKSSFDKNTPSVALRDVQTAFATGSSAQAARSAQNTNPHGSFWMLDPQTQGIRPGSGTQGSRSHAANQVIRRGENGNDPTTRLPIGTTIRAKLVNSIISSNTGSPVIAQIPEEILVHGLSSVPEGTQAIGQATFDESIERIQIHFNTLVYPDGDQHSIDATAMMPDGSAGLVGDYHSEALKREAGSFLGNFISGFATGMEDRTAAAGLGLPYEVGSLKNGVLNGATQSVQNETKAYSDGLSRSKPYMTLSGGQSFVIYLGHEYLP